MTLSEEIPQAVSREALEPLLPVDHAWLRMDDPTNLMIINGVLVLAEPLGRDRVKELLRERLLSIERFRQRVVRRRGTPFWEIDPGFDLDEHLFESTLSAPGGDEELRREISDLMSRPFDPRRPLWSFHLFQKYRGGCVLLARLHHCIGDGMALLLVLLSLTDATHGPVMVPEVPEECRRNLFAGLFSKPPQGIEAARQLAERIMPDGIRLLQQTAQAFASMNPLATGIFSTGALARLVARPPDPKTLYKGPLGIPKRVAWSERIPVAEVKEIGKALGGTINDVLLSAMTGGLRRYMDRRGERAEGINFRAAMPVNLRPLERMAELGNQFGLIFLSLPVGAANAVERLRELRRRALALKRSAEPVVVYAILKLLGVVPLAVQKLVVKIFAAKTTAVMTNVPGPREVLYLAGKPIEEIFFWVPQSGRVSLGISIFSYAGHVRLGVGTDAGLVPDPEVIVQGFHEELDELRRRAGVAVGAPAEPEYAGRIG
ncbi:MAG TPA: wax ester/triacylglycerol synthase family O-acyltransferase [Thermoanaerobaculia bacterium]|nr:wax ester/triacylglycerol synthase family O-acyltransferase [Thermoanaerobaculia bacterium]